MPIVAKGKALAFLSPIAVPVVPVRMQEAWLLIDEPGFGGRAGWRHNFFRKISIFSLCSYSPAG
jgi:hypothetical protein